MAANTGWIIKKGELQYKVRFKLDGDQLSADNEVVVGQLQVAPAGGGDEVKRRIGLPLGLIVALIKDQKGDIRASVPVTGPSRTPSSAFDDAIWTAVKNVLVNVVTAPFKAIGRLFSGGGGGETVEEPKVDAVTFAAGSAVLSPAMEDHLLRVADFLRGSPFVNLTLTSAPSRADADAIRTRGGDGPRTGLPEGTGPDGHGRRARRLLQARAFPTFLCRRRWTSRSPSCGSASLCPIVSWPTSAAAAWTRRASDWSRWRGSRRHA